MKIKLKKNFFFIVVICLFIINAMVWIFNIPYNCAPDEAMRYDVCEYMYEYGKLPRGDNAEVINEIWGTSYAFTPMLSYIISTISMKFFSLFSQNSEGLYIVARLVSMFFSVGTIIICAKIANEFMDGVFGKCFVAFVSFLPQFVFISSYVNNDAFGIFTTAWIWYTLFKAEKSNWDFKSCVFLGIGIGLCMLSYYNCYGVIVVALFYAVISVVLNKNIEHKLLFVVQRMIWVAVVAFLVAGWWFIRSAILYDGDIFGLNASRECSEKYALESFKPSNRQTPAVLGIPLGTMLFEMQWLRVTIKSFVGCFDYMTLDLLPSSYYIMYSIMIIGMLGLLKVTKENSFIKVANRIIWECSMLGACVVTISLSLYYSYFSDFQAQGRYLLPMLIPFGIMLAKGWSNISYRWSLNNKQLFACTLITCLFVVMISATLDVIIPAY